MAKPNAFPNFAKSEALSPNGPGAAAADGAQALRVSRTFQPDISQAPLNRPTGKSGLLNKRTKEGGKEELLAGTEGEVIGEPIQMAQVNNLRVAPAVTDAPIGAASGAASTGGAASAGGAAIAGSAASAAGGESAVGSMFSAISSGARAGWKAVAEGGVWSAIGGVAAVAVVDRELEYASRTDSSSGVLSGILRAGRVIDGPIRDADVYIDENDDGIAQPGEKIGTTGPDGRFSVTTTKTGDYIITGGTNADTGLANNITLKGVAGSTVMTPLTTLVEEYMEAGAGLTPPRTAAEAQTAIKAAFGIDPSIDLTTYDPLVNDNVALQKLAVQLATAAEIYEKAGSGYGDQFIDAIIVKIQDGTFDGTPVLDLTDAGHLTTLHTQLEVEVGASVSSALITSIETATTLIGTATTVAEISTQQQLALNANLTVAEAATATGTYGLMDTAANLAAAGGTILANAQTVVVTGSSAAAADLLTIDSATTAVIDASSVGTLTGTAANIISVYSANTGGTISGLGNETVTVSDSSSIANLNTIGAATTGIVTATISDNDIATLAGLTGTGNAYTVTVTDASVDAADLNTLDG
ncbi:MAG: hypothetical protein Q8M20_02045, partial [Rhodocyclaceae bacterium]|nr:hypothetical protein [Rhodocyclaceae bacterium]